MISVDFGLRTFKVDDWNASLSPWKAPAVFGNKDFGDGAEETLCELKSYSTTPPRSIICADTPWQASLRCGQIAGWTASAVPYNADG